MTRAQRRSRLREIGQNTATIAGDLGVSDSFVSRVLRGKERSARIEEHVAALLGTTRDVAFPPRRRAVRRHARPAGVA